MKQAIVLVVMGVLTMGGLCARAEVDMIATNLQVQNINQQTGVGEVTATITFLGRNVEAISTRIHLILDGLVLANDPVFTLPYSGTGCVYHDTGPLGPYCEQTDACDLWYMGRFYQEEIPGYCVGNMAGGVIYACYCYHDWQVLWTNVPLGMDKGVDVITVSIDPDGLVPELDEANNVRSISGPVGAFPATWGCIKSLYGG